MDGNSRNTVPRYALRPAEAARSIGISERKFWTLIKDEIGPPTMKLGRVTLVPVEGLSRWLKDQSAIEQSNDLA